MKIAAYTSSWNDKDNLHRCIAAIRQQTYPIQKIIVVDNRSSDGTPLEIFPEDVVLLCHLRNLGTSGAAATALEYAMDCHCEWLWVLDQDSIPRKDALQKLVELFNGFPRDTQRHIGVLSSVTLLDSDEQLVFAQLFTREGPKLVKIPQDRAYFESDTTIWSGSLYNLEATKQVGLPRFGPGGFWEDFGLDMGDPEYGYRIKRAGYTVLVHRGSIIDHRIGHITKTTLFGRTFVTSHHPAFRRYLSFRNLVYFWLYIHPDRKLLPVLLFLLSRLVKEIIRIAVLEKNARVKICACTIGAWDGIRKNLHCNYDR